MAKQQEKSQYETKKAIGNLFRAVTMSTDPAYTLSFSSALLTTTRASLIAKLEDKVPDHEMIPHIFTGILKTLVRGFAENEDEIKEIDKRITAVFKSEPMARYGLEIYRDCLIIESLLNQWKVANQRYILSHDAWPISNEILTNIHTSLHEIIVRHDLMQFPKGEMYNVDNDDLMASALAKVLTRAATTEEPR